MQTGIATLLPDARIVLQMVPLALGVAAVFGWLAWRLRSRHDVAVPYTRKLFHIGIFSVAAAVQLALGTQAVIVYGGTVALVVVWSVLRGDGHPLYEALARPTDSPHRTLFILVPLVTTALGGLASNLLFDGAAVAAGYLVAGWGDAMGEPVGARWGRHRYRVPSLLGVPANRSLEGSIAVWLAGTLATGIGLSVAGIAGPDAWLIAVAAGLAGALVEAISNHGIDNLTVQLAAAAVTAWLLPG